MKKVYWRIIPFIVFITLVMFFWRGLFLDPRHLPSVRLGKLIPKFRLPVITEENTKQPQKFSQTLLHGQISLLNIWASWCGACLDEQYFLMQLAHQGVTIYGINYKDNLTSARKWLAEWGNPYKMIGADQDGKVAIDLGVYGAPETFLIDKSGIIRYRYSGILNASIWKKEFLPRIKELELAS